MKRGRQYPYGYGITDRHGQPWWDDACVCQDRGPLDEVVENLNDTLCLDKDDRRPYKVVLLIWERTP